jgi:hypothetical protein
VLFFPCDERPDKEPSVSFERHQIVGWNVEFGNDLDDVQPIIADDYLPRLVWCYEDRIGEHPQWVFPFDRSMTSWEEVLDYAADRIREKEKFDRMLAARKEAEAKAR